MSIIKINIERYIMKKKNKRLDFNTVLKGFLKNKVEVEVKVKPVQVKPVKVVEPVKVVKAVQVVKPVKVVELIDNNETVLKLKKEFFFLSDEIITKISLLMQERSLSTKNNIHMAMIRTLLRKQFSLLAGIDFSFEDIVFEKSIFFKEEKSKNIPKMVLNFKEPENTITCHEYHVRQSNGKLFLEKAKDNDIVNAKTFVLDSGYEVTQISLSA